MESPEQRISEFTANVTARAKDTPAIAQAMHTFLKRYDNITKSGTFATARLSSTLHRFGWVFGGNTSSSQGGTYTVARGSQSMLKVQGGTGVRYLEAKENPTREA